MSSDTCTRRIDLPRLPRVVETSNHALHVLDARWPLTVIRAPRGYGKTSTLAAWLSSLEGPSRTAYLSLTKASNRISGFWLEVHSNLVRTGLLPHIEEVTAIDAETAVIDVLARPGKPLTIILDNFHEAGLHEGSIDIDERLTALLQQNNDLFIVACGRMLRSLEAMGAQAVETAVIGPQELRLTGPMVHRLANRLGVELNLCDAAELADDLGGWPSAIRTGLVSSVGQDKSGRVDRGLIDDYIAMTVREARFDDVRSFLMRTAIPDEFDIETARIIGSEDAVRLAHTVHAGGLLSEQFTAEGPTYTYPPAIRRALRRLVRQSHPEIEHDVHLALMRRWQDRDRPAKALLHAAQAGEWQTALTIVDSQWRRMLIEDPLSLRHAAQLFPTAMAQENPRLTVALKHLDFARNTPPSSSYNWSESEFSRLSTELATQRAAAQKEIDDELVVLVHWGITNIMAGYLDASMYAFSQARDFAMREGEDSPGVHIGTVGLALVHALLGEPNAALEWLSTPALVRRLEQAEQDQSEDVVRQVAAMARAFAHVDRADEKAAQSVAALSMGTHRDELWALSVFIRGLYVASTGTVDDLTRAANEVNGALRYLHRSSLFEAVLSVLLVELFVLAGRAHEARDVVEGLDLHGFSWIASAMLHAAEGEYSASTEAAARVIKLNEVGGRYTLPATVMLAVAHYRAGNHDASQTAFTTAVEIARDTGRRRPFSLMPKHIFDDLARVHGNASELWPLETAGATPDRPYQSAATTALTIKELEILHALADHAGPVGIANAIGLSTNTVKTHLRGVYRKLGVTGREEALAVSGPQAPIKEPPPWS